MSQRDLLVAGSGDDLNSAFAADVFDPGGPTVE